MARDKALRIAKGSKAGPKARKVKINQIHFGLDTSLNRPSQMFVIQADSIQKDHDVRISSKDKKRTWAGKIDTLLAGTGWCIARVSYTGQQQPGTKGTETLDVTIANPADPTDTSTSSPTVDVYNSG
jgi:hypothetical protein